MDLILVPGMWLDASIWDPVLPRLEEAGHRPHALTLPGLDGEADRSAVTVGDQVRVIVAAIDAVGEEQVVLVGHSLGGALAHAAADARPDRVARVVHVASEPASDGAVLAAGWPTDETGIPFPEWDFFDEEMVGDLDEEQRAALRARVLPAPPALATEPVPLVDERRYDVPATVIACEYSSAQLREWIARGEAGAVELGRLRHVEYVDLHCGHWPQVSRPTDLAQTIVDAVGGPVRR